MKSSGPSTHIAVRPLAHPAIYPNATFSMSLASASVSSAAPSPLSPPSFLASREPTGALSLILSTNEAPQTRSEVGVGASSSYSPGLAVR
jgi:hypothetical protein